MYFKYNVGECVVVGDFVSHYCGYNKEIGLVIDRYTIKRQTTRHSDIWYEIFVYGQIMPYLESNIKSLNYHQGENYERNMEKR